MTTAVQRAPLSARGVIGIALLATVAQWPALGGGGVWEDHFMIFKNPRILADDGLYRFWFTTEQSDYWPLSYSIFWIEWRLWGDWAPGYRLVNLALHVLNSVLVWRILARLEVRPAWICGALFAVHPLTVEAVAWPFQLKTILSSTLAFASLACYLLYEDKGRRGWYVGSILLFLLAMLAKSAAVMWPFVVLLVSWWRRRAITRQDLWRAAPFFAVSLALGLIGMWFQTHRSLGEDAAIVRTDPLWSRAAIAGCAVWFYAYKALLPINLSFVYPRWELAQPSLMAFLPGMSLVALLVLCWLYRHRWGAAPGVALSYYVLNLFPVLGFITIYFMRYSFVADHWQYLALPGILALVVGSVEYFLARKPEWSSFRIAFHDLAIGLLVLASIFRAQVYGAADNVPLWEDTLKKNPDSWLAHHQLIIELNNRGDYAQALEHAREAMRIDPTYQDDYVRASLLGGEKAAARGQHDLAILAFRYAIELDPMSSDAYLLLFRELYFLHGSSEALAKLRQVIAQSREGNAVAVSLAWKLATHPDPSVRNPQLAIELVAPLCSDTQNANALHLDTLATAYAAAAQWDAAVQTERAALQRARHANSGVNIAELEARLKLFESGRSYVAP